MRRLFSGVALLALAGCGVPPHVAQKPVIENPATQGAFREGDALQQTGAVSRDDLPARWWHLYDDPVLDTLEEQALAANIDLRVAQASLTRARAVSAAAEGQREPDFAASFGVQRARLSGESYLLEEPIPVATLGTASASMSYQIDLFGRIKHSIEAARADEEATEATIGAVKVTLARMWPAPTSPSAAPMRTASWPNRRLSCKATRWMSPGACRPPGAPPRWR